MRVLPLYRQETACLESAGSQGLSPYGVGPKSWADTYPQRSILSELSEAVAGS